ncbi:MAG: hypothetical protein ACLFPE_01425 [Bacteroidales bacterium]
MKILTIWSIIFWLLASPVPLPAQEDHSHEPESQNTTDIHEVGPAGNYMMEEHEH